MSRWLRARLGSSLTELMLAVAELKITPLMLTVGGLVMMLAAGITLATHHSTLGAILILAGGILDAADGELARATLAASRRGAFLDSICDHVGDAAIYFGLLFSPLGSASRIDLILIVLAMFGSLFGSLVRSRAEMAGVGLKDVGIATRFERLAVLVVGLLANAITVALCVVAALGNLSAFQRVIRALRETAPSTPVEADELASRPISEKPVRPPYESQDQNGVRRPRAGAVILIRKLPNIKARLD